jgi:hypothetical protein
MSAALLSGSPVSALALFLLILVVLSTIVMGNLRCVDSIAIFKACNADQVNQKRFTARRSEKYLESDASLQILLSWCVRKISATTPQELRQLADKSLRLDAA